jgi:hypothetical protein
VSHVHLTKKSIHLDPKEIFAPHSPRLLLSVLHFWFSKGSALHLDITAGGSFTHKTTAKGVALLDRIVEHLYRYIRTGVPPARVSSPSVYAKRIVVDA